MHQHSAARRHIPKNAYSAKVRGRAADLAVAASLAGAPDTFRGSLPPTAGACCWGAGKDDCGTHLSSSGSTPPAVCGTGRCACAAGSCDGRAFRWAPAWFRGSGSGAWPWCSVRRRARRRAPRRPKVVGVWRQEHTRACCGGVGAVGTRLWTRAGAGQGQVCARPVRGLHQANNDAPLEAELVAAGTEVASALARIGPDARRCCGASVLGSSSLFLRMASS